MSNASIPEGAVLVGVENWPAATESVSWAAEQAFRDGRDLCLLHVVTGATLDTPPGFRAGAPSELDQDHGAVVLATASRYADRRLDELSRAPDFLGFRRPEVRVDLQVGPVASALDAASSAASLLVLGSRGRGPISSRILGSVSRSALVDARCPVVVLRPGAGELGRGVLVGIDGTSDSIPALEFAFAQAAQRSLPVTVLYCYRSGGADRSDDRVLVAESVAGLRERYPDLHPHLRIEAGSLAHTLSEQSPTMHMVVAGSSSTGVAKYLLDHAHGVVAVIPPALSRADTSPPTAAV